MGNEYFEGAVGQSDAQSAKMRQQSGDGLADIMDSNRSLVFQRMMFMAAALGFVGAVILSFMGYFWLAVALAGSCLILWAVLGFQKLRNEDKKRHADMIRMRQEAKDERVG